jgi:outer membrane protein assembly factor BamB
MFIRSILGVTILIAAAVPQVRADEAKAKEILERIGSSKGICVLLGDVGNSAADLAKLSPWTLFVQVPDAGTADKLRRELDAAGLLGSRVYVQQGDYRRLHLADDLADAVIGPDASVPGDEVLRILRPQAKGYLGSKTLTKGFRAGTDEWSHPYHGPDNNPQSADTVVRRPFMTHFMAEPWYCPLPMMSVISGGRVFKVFGDRSSAKPQEPLVNKLMAMNAFNGTVLWQRDLSPGFMIHRNTLIATPDTLFLGDDKACHLLDTVTGQVRDTIVVPADKSEGPVWKWMALEDGVLYALVGAKETSDEPLKSDRIRGAGWPWWKIKNFSFGNGKDFLAIDPKTKKVLWHHHEPESIDARGLVMRKGRIYYTCEEKFLACLDAKTGQVVWKNKDRNLLDAIGTTKDAQHWLLGFASTAYLKCSDEALFFAGPNRPYLAAASTKDGKLLWKRDCGVNMAINGKTMPTEGGNVLLVLRSEGLYALGQGRLNGEASSMKLNPMTGEVLAKFPSRDRCTRATGCADTIFTRGGKGGSTAVFDVTSQEPRMGTLSPMRPACQDGVVTAHGYLFWGPWMCRCDMTQLGVISLGPGGTFDYLAAAKESERLQSSATGGVAKLDVRAADWPVYRKDNAHSVRTDHTTPAKVEQLWIREPKTATLPTAPITAGGVVFLSGEDGVIRALDAKSGAIRWSAYTGGPLKYPPALADDRLYAGSGDGYVYCFEAATGKTLWRFRAAPVERMMPVYGNLASTWSLGGGVLVHDGVVYAAAGISNFDGTHVFALDAKTGKIRWQQHSASHGDDDLPMGGVSVQGPMILHDKAVHFAAGNTPPIASYALADGKFTGLTDNGRGKELYLRGGEVRATGFPLYWRPADDHFLSTIELECPAGVLNFGIPPLDPTAPNKFALYPPSKPGEKVAEKWSNHKIFHEIAAVAFTKNAILVTGLDRRSKDPRDIVPAICAVSLVDGKPMWKMPLPATPTAWGLALDADGRMFVTLMDGRVVAFR